MPPIKEASPFAHMHQSTSALRENSMFAERRAAAMHSNARSATATLENMDVDNVYKQMRELIAFASSN